MVETACVWLGFKQLLVKAVCMWWASGSPFTPPIQPSNPSQSHKFFFSLLFYSLSGSPTVPLNPAVPGDFISHGHCNEILVPPVAQTCGLLLVIIMAVGWATHWWVTASTALYTVAWRVPPPLGRYSWTWEWSHHMLTLEFSYGVLWVIYAGLFSLSHIALDFLRFKFKPPFLSMLWHSHRFIFISEDLIRSVLSHQTD